MFLFVWIFFMKLSTKNAYKLTCWYYHQLMYIPDWCMTERATYSCGQDFCERMDRCGQTPTGRHWPQMAPTCHSPACWCQSSSPTAQDKQLCTSQPSSCTPTIIHSPCCYCLYCTQTSVKLLYMLTFVQLLYQNNFTVPGRSHENKQSTKSTTTILQSDLVCLNVLCIPKYYDSFLKICL